jgi:hypothetical protein
MVAEEENVIYFLFPRYIVHVKKTHGRGKVREEKPTK